MKKLKIMLALVTMLLILSSCGSNSNESKNSKNSINTETINITDDDGNEYIYEGQLDDEGVPNGKGKLYNEGILLYDGETVHGVKEGTGTLYGPDGDYYTGDFKNDEMNGKGKYYDAADNLIFEGNVVNGERNGYGILYNDDGSISYKGKFKNNKPYKESAAEKFANKHKLSTKKGINYYNALKNIGIKPENIDIKEKSENSISFDYEFYSFKTIFEGDKVKTLNSGDIYFIKDFKKKENVKNRIATAEERALLITKTKTIVKSVLKAPKTADFPGTIMESESWEITKNKKTYIVSSYVDAKNSFGAEIRSEYTLAFDWNGDTDTLPELTSFIFDGEQMN